MTIEEVKKFLIDNAEQEDVKAFRAELSNPTEAKVSEIVEAFKKSKDFQSEIDRAVTKGVQTHDEKIKPILEKELRAKITNELNPPKDPAVVALQEQLNKLQEEKAAADLAAQNEKRVNFFHAQIKPDYKDFVKLFDGSISDDAEKIKFVNEKLFELQTKTAPKPTTGTTAGMITDRAQLAGKSPAEIAQLTKDGKLAGMLGQAQQ